MKTLFTGSLIAVLFFSQQLLAQTPTETLEIAVNKILAVAGDQKATAEDKTQNLTKILSSEVDFEAVSKRVVSKSWKKANDAQKAQFKSQFLDIMVGTYSALLNNYTNEEVLFDKEQIKGKKSQYAIVDTKIISDGKKIPVRYRLIKTESGWKIYDFIPEGISLISTYKNNYASILKKQGMDGLLVEMKKLEEKKQEAKKAAK